MPAPDPSKATLESFDVKGEGGLSEQLVDAIEMIGEETAAGMRTPHSKISPGMRYLHASRTIHQLVTDRNRAVGIYMTAASLLMTACGVMLNTSHRPSPPCRDSNRRGATSPSSLAATCPTRR